MEFSCFRFFIYPALRNDPLPRSLLCLSILFMLANIHCQNANININHLNENKVKKNNEMKSVHALPTRNKQKKNSTKFSNESKKKILSEY